MLTLSGKFHSADLLTPKANAIYEENLEWPTQDKLQVEVHQPSWHSEDFRCILRNWNWSSSYDLYLIWNRQGLFTWARWTGIRLPGPIWSSGFIWEFSARIPRWQKTEDELWCAKPEKQSKHGKTQSYKVRPIISLATVITVSQMSNGMLIMWKIHKAKQDDAEFIRKLLPVFIPVTRGLKCSYGKISSPLSEIPLRIKPARPSHMNTSKILQRI